ncbi:MAG: DUF3786 domain-containing protein [Desulfobacterales bacterium]|nr:DUF3786 domain-containing protein [Desulfobacterales bacterium]
MSSVPIAPVHFDDLKHKDPETVCRHTGAMYHPETGGYTLDIWQRSFLADPAGRSVSQTGGDPIPKPDYAALFVVHYLLGATEADVSGDWVSEKDIPGGAAFFRGPHTLPTQGIVDTFGDDLERFKGQCGKLGGRPLDMADAAFAFDITPNIPVAVLYWQGDEDFGAEAKLLFDRSISAHLALDIIYALAVMVCKMLSKT